jgi:hypothetical protein
MSESVQDPVAPVDTGPDTSKDAEWADTAESSEKTGVEPPKKTLTGGETPEPSSESPPEDEEQESLDDLSDKERNSVFAARRRERQTRRELDDLKLQIADQPAQTTEQPGSVAQSYGEPEPQIDNFNSVAEHQEAVKSWGQRIKTAAANEERQRVAGEQVAAQEAANREVEAEHYKGVKKRYESEYDDLCDEFSDFDKVAKATNPYQWTPDQSVIGWFVNKPGGLRTGYHLSKNPDEVERIFNSSLDMSDQLVELEILRRDLTPESETSNSGSGSKPTMRKPPRRVSSTGRAGKSWEDKQEWVNG